VTKLNYAKGPDRSTKFDAGHARGLRGSTYGAAGPVKRIDPDTLSPAQQQAALRDIQPHLRAYYAFRSWCISTGRTAPSFKVWTRDKAKFQKLRREAPN
jgi:hypothetical protein